MDGLLANTQPKPQPGFWRGLLDAFGQDAAAARDWFVFNMQRASGGGILGEGETDAGARAGAGMALGALGMTGAMPGGVFAAPRGAVMGAGPIRAYHGSPHDFDKFDIRKIGTGEGAQAYGHGLYFAENEGVARSYRDALAIDPRNAVNRAINNIKSGGEPVTSDGLMFEFRRHKELDSYQNDSTFKNNVISVINGTNDDGTLTDGAMQAIRRLDKMLPPPMPGRMYEVAIHADPARFLDWDKPLSQQGPDVRKFFDPHVAPIRENMAKPAPGWGDLSSPQKYDPTGNELLSLLRRDSDVAMSPHTFLGNGLGPDVSESLRQQGIPGIRYLDAGSRGAKEGSRNYVVFDDNLIEILRKYGLLAPTVGVGGGLLATQDSQAAPR